MSVMTKPTFMRLGRLEKTILTTLLKNGAKTVHELAFKIEEIDLNSPKETTRSKAFYRAVNQLHTKRLIVIKPYFKFEKSFCGYMAHNFWAEGYYWQRYNRSGFHRKRTIYQNYGHAWRWGLTSEGKKQLLKRLFE